MSRRHISSHGGRDHVDALAAAEERTIPKPHDHTGSGSRKKRRALRKRQVKISARG
jgi:hypothetical protein